ncbi:MAG: TolC family protein [Novosphingobium sp.]
MGALFALFAFALPIPTFANSRAQSISIGSDAAADLPQSADNERAFWASFGDPELPHLIDLAMAQNPSLQIMRSRLIEAKSNLKSIRAALQPSVDLATSANLTQGIAGLVPGGARTASGSLQISYELDVSGSNHARAGAAAARISSSASDLQSVRLTTGSEIARNFILLSSLRSEGTFLQRELQSALKIETIVAARRAEGESLALDDGLLAQQKAAIEADLISLAQEEAQLLSALAVLTGQEPRSFNCETQQLQSLRALAIDVEQPLELVSQRPDVKAAEYRLSAERLDAASLRRSLLPNVVVSANGVGATLTSGLGGLFTAGASVIASIFDGGARKARIGAGNARADAALANHRSVLLVSLQEVAVSLAMLDGSRRRLRIWENAVNDSNMATASAEQMYLEGAVTITSLIEARRLELVTLRAATSARRDILLASVDVFRAMGGVPRMSPSDQLSPSDFNQPATNLY